jgi:hypothetical protein
MYDPDDPSYGVTTNKKSYERGVKANNQIHNEVMELCQVNKQHVHLKLLFLSN